MPKLWRNGRWERVASIERGRMLVHSGRELGTLMMSTVGIYSAMTLVIILVAIPVLMYRDPVFVLQLGFFLAVVLYLWATLLHGWRHLSTGGSVPGVYERGVEVPWGKFIPCGEIMSTQRTRALFGKVLVIQLRPSGRKLILGRMVVGADDWALVESMVRSAGPAGARMERPRLVVYPSGDGAASPLEHGPGGRIR
jgi:hypothetical protein